MTTNSEPLPTHDDRRSMSMGALGRAARWLLVIVAIVLGVVGAIVALLATVVVTGSRTLAAAAAALAVVLVSGGLSRLAVRNAWRDSGWRRWLPGAVAGTALVFVAALLGPLVFAPAPGYTPIVETGATQYWELSTGSRIAYTHTPAQGTAQGVPVILIHGGPGAPEGGLELVKGTLADAGFDVYSYHQIGAGLSERLEDVTEYTVARHVADLEAIRREIGSDQVILVGESWGGTLIAHYLAAHPTHVAKAVVSSPGPIWAPAFANGLTASGREDQDAVIVRLPRFMMAHVLISTIGPRATHALLPDRQMDGVFEDLVGRLDLWSGCAAAQHPNGKAVRDAQAGVGFWANAMTALDAQHVTDPRPVLRSVSTPMLILRSECDYRAWDATREYRDILPNAVLLTVEDAGHVIPLDRPQLYRQAVAAFLLGRPLPQEPYTGTEAPW